MAGEGKREETLARAMSRGMGEEEVGRGGSAERRKCAEEGMMNLYGFVSCSLLLVVFVLSTIYPSLSSVLTSFLGLRLLGQRAW